MGIETPEPFEGFGFAIRTFWIKGTNLRIGRKWSREPLTRPDRSPEFSVSIYGNAISEKDDVCIIGRAGAVKEFPLTLKSDEDAKSDWELLKNTEGWRKDVEGVLEPDLNVSTPEIRLKRRIYERLDESPPTATLFTCDGDWEVGIAGWLIECMLPVDVLAKLEQEIAAQSIRSVRIGITWEAGLVRDEHAPPSFPTTWGMFRISDKARPEPLRGHVTLIDWQSGSTHGDRGTTVAETPAEVGETPLGREMGAEAMASTQATATPASVIINVPRSAIAALWTIALAILLLLLK